MYHIAQSVYFALVQNCMTEGASDNVGLLHESFKNKVAPFHTARYNFLRAHSEM